MKQKNSYFKFAWLMLAFACIPCFLTAGITAEARNGIMQQAVKISGQVVDTHDEPIAGASVAVKGTTTGIVTDIDGKFTLDVPSQSVLQVSFIGYVTQEIPTEGKTAFRIVLAENVELLEEVVVVGYGTMKRSDLTGAVASVSNNTLTIGGKSSPVGSLQGIVPGVNIVKSNAKPGGEYSIDIRGISSISGSNTPLVVIDGIPGGNLDYVNPDDIEKIDILKDASATAIYGSRGANGVIIVSTKRGATGKPRISYSGYFGFKKYTNMPDIMNGVEYVDFVRETAKAMNNNVLKTDEEIFTDPSELKAVRDGNYFDWIDAMSEQAVITNHSISAAGGTDAAKYTFAGGYFKEEGMIYPQDYERFNLRTAVDLKANDYLSFGGNMYMTHVLRDVGANMLQDAYRLRPTQHPYSLVTGEEIWRFSNGQFNHLISRENEFLKTKTTNLFGNIYLALTPANGLELKSTFAPYIENVQSGQYRGVWTKANQGTSAGATANMRKYTNTNWVWDNIVNYKWKRDRHSIDATGVFSMQQTQYENEQINAKDLKFNSLWYNLQGGEMTGFSTAYTQTNLMAYLLRVNYSFMDRYMITASGRYDGSSKLAEGHKWAFFPSAALGWRIGEEPFLRDINWLSNLKLRLSYGQTGNDNVSAYSSGGTISGSQYYSFASDVIGNVPNNLRNSKLGWEKTSEYNIGIDFGLLKNRISGNIEYYNRLTEGLIMSRSVPVHLGYSSITDNVGSVRNRGVELGLNTVNIQSKDFSWTTQFSLSYNKNEIVDLVFQEDLGVYSEQLEGMKGDYSNLWIIGQPIRVNWNLMTVGVWQLGEEAEAAKYGQRPGQFRVKDFDEDGTIHNDKDRFLDGKRTPDWVGGMANTFRYRDVDFSFHVHFRTGARERSHFFNNFGLPTNYDLNVLNGDYWTPENPSNTMAQPSNMGPYRGSGDAAKNVSYLMFDTDFLKVSYITLGYTFEQKYLSKLKMSNLRLYITAQNPFTFTSFIGVDPEFPSTDTGISDMMTANYLVGLNVSF
jgi:TonB-linked SusC/RagA family outer membrane protein